MTADEADAVADVAAQLGLGPVVPTVLSVAEHAIIRLAPHPVVVKLRSAGLSDEALVALGREGRIAAFPAKRQAPVVRPARIVDPGPHVRAACAMTLWDLVDHRAVGDEADARLAAHALQRIHEAMDPFGDDLPPFTAAIDAAGASIKSPDRSPCLAKDDRRFLSDVFDLLRDELRHRPHRLVPLHGDAHLGNALVTRDGVIWGDFEAACSGPREWDVASLPESVWPIFERVDHDLAERLAALRSLCVAAWCWRRHGRSKEIDEAAETHLGILRSRFPRA